MVAGIRKIHLSKDLVVKTTADSCSHAQQRKKKKKQNHMSGDKYITTK